MFYKLLLCSKHRPILIYNMSMLLSNVSDCVGGTFADGVHDYEHNKVKGNQ